MFGMLMGSMFLLPVFCQESLHYTATLSGIVLMPRTLAMMVAWRDGLRLLGTRGESACTQEGKGNRCQHSAIVAGSRRMGRLSGRAWNCGGMCIMGIG